MAVMLRRLLWPSVLLRSRFGRGHRHRGRFVMVCVHCTLDVNCLPCVHWVILEPCLEVYNISRSGTLSLVQQAHWSTITTAIYKPKESPPHSRNITSTHISLMSHSPSELNVFQGCSGYVKARSKFLNSSNTALCISINATLRPKHTHRP